MRTPHGIGVPIILWPEVEMLSMPCRKLGRIAVGTAFGKRQDHGVEGAIDMHVAALTPVACTIDNPHHGINVIMRALDGGAQ